MKYSKTNANNCLKECKRLLDSGVLPSWDDLPEIDLYMDVCSLELFVKDVNKSISTRVYFEEENLNISFNQNKMVQSFVIKERKWLKK